MPPAPESATIAPLAMLTSPALGLTPVSVKVPDRTPKLPPLEPPVLWIVPEKICPAPLLIASALEPRITAPPPLSEPICVPILAPGPNGVVTPEISKVPLSTTPPIAPVPDSASVPPELIVVEPEYVFAPVRTSLPVLSFTVTEPLVMMLPMVMVLPLALSISPAPPNARLPPVMV